MARKEISSVLSDHLGAFEIASDEWGARAQAINCLYTHLMDEFSTFTVDLQDDTLLGVADSFEKRFASIALSEWGRKTVNDGIAAIRNLAHEKQSDHPKTLGELHVH